jgi:membrane fusion protein (multidrug efflux system)
MIGQAEAALASAEVEVDRARLDRRRYAALVSSDYASRQRFETAEADARKAEAAFDKARAALVAERSQLAVLQSQKGEEEARLAQARASLVLARNDLDNTMIRAPVAGVVGNRTARVGQYVKPGTQLAALVPLPYVHVTANFKETQLTRMRPGQQADIAVDAYPGQTITGTIESFSPASGAQFSLLPPDNATGNFTKIVQRVPVRIALPSDAPLLGLLRPGLSVTVSVDTRRAPHSGMAAGVAARGAATRSTPERSAAAEIGPGVATGAAR